MRGRKWYLRKPASPKLEEIFKKWRLSAREYNDIDTSRVPQETEE